MLVRIVSMRLLIVFPYQQSIGFFLSEVFVRFDFAILDGNVKGLFALHAPKGSFICRQREITLGATLRTNNVRH